MATMKCIQGRMGNAIPGGFFVFGQLSLDALKAALGWHKPAIKTSVILKTDAVLYKFTVVIGYKPHKLYNPSAFHMRYRLSVPDYPNR